MTTPTTQPATVDPNKALELNLAASKAEASMFKKQLDAINAQLKTATGRTKTLLQNQVNALTTKLAFENAKVTKYQNTLYENTGQYEKLLTGANRDAYLAVESLFKTYDLGTLAGKIYDYVKKGYSADTISILLQDTSEYKTRFAGNEIRKAQGLPVLSPAEYLSTEAAYKQIMSSAGLPVGFYDQSSDFNNWIGKDVSATEIQSRVDMATQATTLASPTYKQALNQMGISDGELTAYFLDQSKALPYIQKKAAAAQIGAQALAQGLTFDTQYAEQLATQGVNSQAAQTGYAAIAAEQQSMQSLASIYGTTWTQRQAEEATFEANAAEVNKRKGLITQEESAFSGAVGGARSGLAQAGGAR